LFAVILDAVEKGDASHIFFALNSFPEICRKLKRVRNSIQLVLLSHGVEAVDTLIRQRLQFSKNQLACLSSHQTKLGGELMNAALERECIDAVLTLSPFEVDIENWLGASRSFWVPRMLTEEPLSPRPINGYAGTVATLDHPPNANGLIRLFEVLARNAPGHLRFRLIGGPRDNGTRLADRFPFVDFLGPLSDEEVRREACQWCVFVNPIFVNAKGCSTKLGLPLGWRTPIATTVWGARGYLWNPQALPLARSPEELASIVIERCKIENFGRYRNETEAIANITPSLNVIGSEIRNFLLSGAESGGFGTAV